MLPCGEVESLKAAAGEEVVANVDEGGEGEGN